MSSGWRGLGGGATSGSEGRPHLRKLVESDPSSPFPPLPCRAKTSPRCHVSDGAPPPPPLGVPSIRPTPRRHVSDGAPPPLQGSPQSSPPLGAVTLMVMLAPLHHHFLNPSLDPLCPPPLPPMLNPTPPLPVRMPAITAPRPCGREWP